MMPLDQALLVLRWYLVVQLFGVAALPLCLRLFRHLPDQGYGVSKALGLLLVGWLFWLMATLGWTRNTPGGILVALAVVAGGGLLLRLAHQPAERPPFPWRVVIATEIVFGLAFVAWCVVRAHMPQIQTAGGEKWMEIAFLRAILRSETFPPHDPWLSGFAISYYYFGYVIMAMLTRMTAVSPSIAFNLGIATLFALTCAGAFSLVHNLLAVMRGRSQAPPEEGRAAGWGAIWGGLLGPLLVAVTGNLEGAMEVLYARGIGSRAFWRWLDIGHLAESPQPFTERFFWWWQASRVIRDYGPTGGPQEVIDEFPAFSFLLGDMHPHVLGLPFVLLALALALNLYLSALRRKRREAPTAGSPYLPGWLSEALADWPLAGWEFLVYTICLGGLGFLNTWDFPIYLFIVAAAYTLASGHGAQPTGQTMPPWRPLFYIPRFGLLFLSLLAAGLTLYIPFWRGFQSQAGGILPNLFNGTRLTQFLVMFGPLVFPAAAYVALQARRAGVLSWRIPAIALAVAAGIAAVVLLVVGTAILSVRLGLIPPHGALVYVEAWLRGEPLPGGGKVPDIWTLVRQRIALDPEMFGAPSPDVPPVPFWAVVARSALASSIWTTLGLAALVVAVILTLGRSGNGRPAPPAEARGFVLLLFATGALLILGVEFVHLRDAFGTRMNTVFKFYFQAWVLWGLAGAYALARFVRQGGAASTAVTLVAVLLIAAGLLYPVLAIPTRADEYGGPPTLDGAAYLERMYPADYAAIAWLNENVAGAPVILEAPGGGYEYEGRVSAHTGLPTLLGWEGHEHQWRGSREEPDRRKPDIERLYTSTNAQEVLTLLDKYGIRYVYVGPVEQRRYPAEGLAKFAALLETVYKSEGVTIYYRR